MSKSKGQGNRVGFFSFFKLNLLYGLAIGQLGGVAFLVMAICGAPVNLDLGSFHVHGLPAGVGALILLPPAFGLASFVLAPVVYVPFTLACQVLGGFKAS